MGETRGAEGLDTRRRGRLMVVDAAETSRHAVAEYFGARGWDVVPVADGVAAVAKGLARDIDVVVMNATLPDVEGYEAAAILRALAPRVPIILTTDPDLDARSHERRRTQRFRCFPKPLDLDALERAIDETGAAPDGPGEEER